MNLPIDQIDPPLDSVRRRAVTPGQHADMVRSIAALGVLQPVLVQRQGNRYVLIDGELRLNAARSAGLAEIPVEVGSGFTGAHATAAQAAANTVRQPLHPIDRWRAMTRLQEAGYGFAAAAEALGISERNARRLDRLGRLHPDVLALIEEHGLPRDNELAAVANAPPETQGRAVAQAGKAGYPLHQRWFDIARACGSDTIPRGRAIFDIEAVAIVWDEDLFAEPGSDDQFTTVDVKGFLAAQKAALAARVEAAKAAKQREAVVAWDAGQMGPKLPNGWHQTYNRAETPNKSDTVLHAVAESGYALGKISSVTARKTPAAKAGKGAAGAGTAQEDAGDEPDLPPPETKVRPPISKAGLDIIGHAKTTAIRERLAGGALGICPPVPTWELLGLLVLALTGRNVAVVGDTAYVHVDFEDLASKLIGADGLFPRNDLDPDDVRVIGAEALARIVVADRPDRFDTSGRVAEWIGRAIGAEANLPRFDTKDFLATMSHAELQRVAAECGQKASGTATALRARLEGALPDWRPCRFAAAGPDADEGDGE